ncbi:MAG: hypothetical protein WBJ13_06130 [Sedimentibacter sp.]
MSLQARIIAIAEIKRCSGTQFDSNITKIFIDMVLEKQINNYQLN